MSTAESTMGRGVFAVLASLVERHPGLERPVEELPEVPNELARETKDCTVSVVAVTDRS